MSTTIDQLEIEITYESKGASDGLDELARSLEKIKKATGGGLGLGSVANQLNATKNVSTKVASSFSDLYTKLRTVRTSIKTIYGFIKNNVDLSSDYVESLNLFTVAMGDYASGAQEYAEQVGEIMGIDPADWMKNQGIFMTLATGFGVAGDRAATMSKQLTQLGYDISSFYNIDLEEAMKKLKSGLSGELEPLRAIGYDLSQAKLEATAAALGIDKAVSAMTQAEKAELRYYAIMTQVDKTHGDMARTLTAPANQMRILKAQVTQAGRAIGNIFIPSLNAILPYAIAVVKVIRVLADAIAGLMGYELSDMSGELTSGADTATAALDNTTDAVKKLKSYTMGFDELNIINPTDSGESEVDTTGGFDFDLPEYDFLAEATENRVAEIVEQMKEWLGITGEIDSWADLFETKLGKILIAVGLVGGAFLMWKISSSFGKVFSTLAGLFGIKSKGITGGSTSGIPSPKTILKGLADLGIIIGGVIAFVGIVGLLTKIPGFDDTIQEGLSMLGTVFKGIVGIILPVSLVSAGMVLLGKVDVGTVAKGLANMGIIIGGTTVLIAAIGGLMAIPYVSDFLSSGITQVTNLFNGLYDIAIPIGALSAYMVVIGLISPGEIALGLAGFAIVIGGTVALITAIGALLAIPHFKDFLSGGIESLKTTFDGLSEIAAPIGVLSALIVVLGFATPATVASGLAGFAIIIGGLEVVLVALGALKQIPGFDWLASEGGKVLVGIGHTLGEFAGAIVGGFGEGVSDSFPAIGQNLADFMDNAHPFIKGMEDVDSELVSGTKSLVQVVLMLTATDIISGLATWLTGKNSLVEFGKKLKEFAPYFVSYSKSMKGVDASVVKTSSEAAKSIVEFANNIPNAGGVAAWFAGDNNIDTFGEKLPSFGKNFKKYADNIAGLDANVVKDSTAAAQSVVEFASHIPNSGGVASWFAGNNDIDTWGAKLPAFGENFKQYADNISGIDTKVVDNTTAAAESIVELCDNIPNSGGVASWFSGDNDVAKFGEKLNHFGEEFIGYYNNIKTIKISTLTSITSGINKIIDFAVRIKDEVDKKAIDNFTDALKSLGKVINGLPNSKSVNVVVNYTLNDNGLSGLASLYGFTIPMYAEGGFPQQGQIFIAREAGAEMVGNIGNRAAVANNDQIVAGIANGVAEANTEQNALLREQNSLLRALLEKDDGVRLDGRTLTKSVERYQRERGRVLVTGGAY